MSVQPKPVAASLDVAGIVNAALSLMAEIGIDALTTRRLADRLGVQGPALYWHVRNKDELLAGMCERLFLDAMGLAKVGGGWQDWLRSCSIELRKSLNGVRDGARLVAASDWSEVSKTVIVDRTEAPLLAAGLTKEQAIRAVAACSSYTLGWVTNESKKDHRSFMASQFDVDEAFLWGLDALLDGLASNVA